MTADSAASGPETRVGLVAHEHGSANTVSPYAGDLVPPSSTSSGDAHRSSGPLGARIVARNRLAGRCTDGDTRRHGNRVADAFRGGADDIERSCGSRRLATRRAVGGVHPRGTLRNPSTSSGGKRLNRRWRVI